MFAFFSPFPSFLRVFAPPNKRCRGQKLKQPISERFVTVSDICGRIGRWGVRETQEIICYPFIFHITRISSSVQCSVNAARVCKVRFIFKRRPYISVNARGSSKGRLSTLSSEGGPPVRLIT